MLTLYFSGTGNSRYVAEGFARRMGGSVHSIEEKADFPTMMKVAEEICFVYPIYLSSPPKIMREFVWQHRPHLRGKGFVILATQMMFSGDGAAALLPSLQGVGGKVLYAAHFSMPNNICNIPVLPVTGGAALQRATKRADHKLDIICADIRNGVVRKTGFSLLGHALGKTQNYSIGKEEKRASEGGVTVNHHCIGCGLCVKSCPTKNFELQNGKAQPRQNCTLCYRCVNLCPAKAIRVLYPWPVQQQYKGPLPGKPGL